MSAPETPLPTLDELRRLPVPELLERLQQHLGQERRALDENGAQAEECTDAVLRALRSVAIEMSEPPRSRRLALLRVSKEMLVQALHLPASVAIVDAHDPPFGHEWYELEFLVEGLAFPLVEPGAELPFLNVVLRRDEHTGVSLERMELTAPGLDTRRVL